MTITKDIERPNVRRWIRKLLNDNPHVSLEDVCRGFYLDESGQRHNLYMTDGRRIMAVKMLLEQLKEAESYPAQHSNMVEEEIVFDNVIRTVYRLPVPGGWIYTTSTLDNGIAMCFVPNTAEVESEISNND